MLLLVLTLLAAPERVTFEVAVERALAHHPAMRLAQQDTARALALLEQSRAPGLPSVQLSGSFTRLDDDRRLADRLLVSKEQFAGSVQVAVPLVGGPRWGVWYRAGRSVDATRAGAADVKRQVAAAAARAWLAVLGQQRLVDAATRARDTAQAHFDFAHQRRELGVGNALDEARAAQELSASVAQLETSLAALARLQEALGVAVGGDAPLDVVTAEPALASPGAEAELLSATHDRLDVRAARVRAEVATDATKVDWLDYLPLLTAVFQPTFQSPPSATQPAAGWQAQALLSLPLYEGGARYGQAHERVALASAAAVQLEVALRGAKSEVRAALAQLTHADAALAASRAAAHQADVALELAATAWQAGATTNLELIDAERRARDAWTQAAIAEDGARQARLDTLLASGRFPAP